MLSSEQAEACFVGKSSTSSAINLKDTASAKALSLREAILLALRYNPDVQNAEIQRVSDKFSLRTSQNNFELQYALTGTIQNQYAHIGGVSNHLETSQIAPTLTKNGIYGTNYSFGMTNQNAMGVYNPGITFQIVQPLLSGFGKDVATASLYNAQETEKINQLNLRNQLLETVTSVINAYRTLVASQNNVIIDELSLQDFQATIVMDNALIKAGRKPPTEVVQAKAEYAQAQLTLQNDKNRVVQDKLALLNILGLSPDRLILIPTDIALCADVTPSLETAYEIALKNNINYLTQTIQVKLDERQLLVDEDANRARLNLNVNATRGNVASFSNNTNVQGVLSNNNTNRMVALDLNVPINDYSLMQAVVNDKGNLQKDRITLNNIARQLKLTLENDLDTVYSNKENIKLADETLKLQEQNQSYLIARLKYGLVSTFEVTTKQQDLDKARIQYIQAKINYLNALTQLYLDMGVTLDKWNIEVRY